MIKVVFLLMSFMVLRVCLKYLNYYCYGSKIFIYSWFWQDLR